MSIKQTLCARIASWLVSIILFVWAAIKLFMDWIGRSTVAEDFAQLRDKLPAMVDWLLQTPWYVPASLAGIVSVFVIWLNRPFARMRIITAKEAQEGGLNIDEIRESGAKVGIRPDTRLRLQRDPAGTGNYLEISQFNISQWQQVFIESTGYMEDGSERKLHHYDTIAITFSHPIAYERPILNSFGHDLVAYSFYSLGTQGAMFQFTGAVDVPVLEIWFPPVGYYAQRQTIQGESPESQAQPDTPA